MPNKPQTNGSDSTRFKKGQSGNPKGRPKKTPTRTPSPFSVLMDRSLDVSLDGEVRKATPEEVLERRMFDKALNGNRPAQREILKVIEKRDTLRNKRSPRWPGALVRYMGGGPDWPGNRNGKAPAQPADDDERPTDPQNAEEALLILGIADHDRSWGDHPKTEKERRLLLEPWAVKAAIRRRRRRKMTDKELREAKRCTRDDETIRWPEPGEE
jgi:hypothetical protein